MSPQLSIIIPFAGDNGGPRDRAAAWCYRRWAYLCKSCGIHADMMIRGPQPSDGERMNLCAITNRAIADSTAPYLLITPADMFLTHSTFAAAMRQLLLGASPAIIPHDMHIRLSKENTAMLLSRDANTDILGVSLGADGGYSNDCCLLVSRAAHDAVNGYDERFAGYGCEEHAYLMAMRTLCGEIPTLSGNLYHLWHPTLQGWTGGAPVPDNVAHLERYHLANGNEDAMSILVAGNR